MFSKVIKNTKGGTGPQCDSKMSIHAISESNIGGINILIDTCIKNTHLNNNVSIATVDPTLWLGEVLDKHWQKISYVCEYSNFEIFKISGNSILKRLYVTQDQRLNNDEELDEFFNNNKWKRLVLHSITKYVDLSIMKSYYNIRCADITEKYEERDRIIEDLLD